MKPSTVDVARVCKKISKAIEVELPIVSANALVAVLELLTMLEQRDKPLPQAPEEKS